MQTICIYTSDYYYKKEKLYNFFNNAVRQGKSTYGRTFPLHTLHYWLTSAIQIQNKYQCYIVYRRTLMTFTGRVNQIICFGSFTSTSLRKDLINFGRETCFKIITCEGGYLKKYSKFGQEEELLIPPYEVFRITNGPGKHPDLSDCRVVFVLESVGRLSYLNCKAAKYWEHRFFPCWWRYNQSSSTNLKLSKWPVSTLSLDKTFSPQSLKNCYHWRKIQEAASFYQLFCTKPVSVLNKSNHVIAKTYWF